MVGKTTIYVFIRARKKEVILSLKYRNRELYNYKGKIADKKSIDECPEIVKKNRVWTLGNRFNCRSW